MYPRGILPLEEMKYIHNLRVTLNIYVLTFINMEPKDCENT
jgi:hypothetical protein